MKVLISHQFNSGMQNLDEASRKEVSLLYSFLSQSDKEHVVASPFTKIVSKNDDIFTLRGLNVRIFCTFSSEADEEVIVLLDVNPISEIGINSLSGELHGETTLFGRRGEPIAYIEDSKEKTIFSFNGEPLAYIDENNNIYGFNGKHLGWFEDQIVWNHLGQRIGFTKATCPTLTKFEPFKGFKQYKPFKGFKHFQPLKPYKGSIISSVGLLEFLKDGRT